MEKINLKFLSLGAFIISLIYTCKLMLTNSSGVTDQALTLGTACVLEFSKCAFLYKALSPNKLGEKAKAIMGIIGSFLFLVSICASLAFLFNQANETSNKNIIKSRAYQQKLEIINDIRQQRDILPINYPTKKIQLTEKLEKLTDELNIEFPLKSTKGYQALFQVATDIISKNHKQELLDANKLQLFFFAIISIVFEVTAIFLFYIHEKEKNELLFIESEKALEKVASNELMTEENILRIIKKLGLKEEEKPIEEIIVSKEEENQEEVIASKGEAIEEVEKKELKNEEIKPECEPLVARKIIGFRPEDAEEKKSGNLKEKEEIKNNFSDDEVEKYKIYMFEQAKENETNIAIGYKKIASAIGIAPGKALKIKNALEMQNIIKSEGLKTFILNEVS